VEPDVELRECGGAIANHVVLLHQGDRDPAAQAPQINTGTAPLVKVSQQLIRIIQRGPALGHEPSFSMPLNNVWNAAMNRHSAPKVG
jgi:hypothetical protein